MLADSASQGKRYGAPGPVDRPALSAAITGRLEGLERSKWHGAELTFRCPAPDHEDRNPSASWKPAAGVWCCHSKGCDQTHGGGALALAALLGIDVDPYRSAAPLPPERQSGAGPTKGADKGQRQPAPAGAGLQGKRPATLEALRRNPRNTVFEYQGADGQTVGLAVRVAHDDGGKHFNTWRPDGAGAWLPERIDGQYPPYRLPAVLDTTGPVYLAEGEKCADALAGVGLTGTTCIMGAGKAEHTDLSALKGRPVVILPDNDEPGAAHAKDVADKLQRIGAIVRVLPPFDPPATFKGKGYDVADWLADGGTAADLEALAKAAPESAAAVGGARRRKARPLPWSALARPPNYSPTTTAGPLPPSQRTATKRRTPSSRPASAAG